MATERAGWAKAPRFDDQRERLAARTEADRRAQLDAGLRPVTCTDCRNTVLVKKNSPAHTSIQWTGDAVAHCPEFARAGRPSALVDSCARLRASIDAAWRGTGTPSNGSVAGADG